MINPESLDFVTRPERAEDAKAIFDLTQNAFAPMPFSDGDEHHLINALRDAGALTISLVAEHCRHIVGHVAFSPAPAESGASGWYALGPVSVKPDLQRQGIGSRLIEQGLDQLRNMGAAGCILVGSLDYYQRFGFMPAPQNCPANEPEEYYQILCMKDDRPQGIIGFNPLFHGK